MLHALEQRGLVLLSTLAVAAAKGEGAAAVDIREFGWAVEQQQKQPAAAAAVGVVAGSGQLEAGTFQSCQGLE